MKVTLFVMTCLAPCVLAAQSTPEFKVDPAWPKPLPEAWITGQLGGVCTDSHDHIVVVNRRDITAEEAETSQQAPPIIMFDLAGNVIASWGDPNVVPHSIHGCSFDAEIMSGSEAMMTESSRSIVTKGGSWRRLGPAGCSIRRMGPARANLKTGAMKASSIRRGSPSIPLMVICTSPMVTGTGVWWCSTKTESSFANGGGRPPMTRRGQGLEACSRASCTAS